MPEEKRLMTLTPDRPLTGPAAPPDSCLSQRADSKALLFDYRQAANPVRPGLSDPIPYCSWGAELHGSGPTAILPLDLSAALGIAGPATSPGLAAHFIRIEANEAIEANANATSSLFFVLSGRGRCRRQLHAGAEAPCIDWQQGDLFVLPAGEQPQLEADSTAVLYWVHDGPLLDYLGVQPNRARFEATHYGAEWLQAELSTLAARPGSGNSNRLSLLLANRDLPQTRTVTHVLWAMFGMVPSIGGPGSDRGLRPGCLQPGGHRTERRRHDPQSQAPGLAGGRGLHHAAGTLALACERERDNRLAAADPGRRTAHPPAQPGHPLRLSPFVTDPPTGSGPTL